MKIKFTLIALIILNTAFAQNYKFGKVSKEELIETSDTNNPEANATVLYRSQNVSFEYRQDKGFVQKNEIHERIKIYNKDGFDQATKFVKLYVGGSSDRDHQIVQLKAITYNFDGKEIIKDKLKKEGIFKEENNKYWETTKFTMPNIKVGSVIEYRYTIEKFSAGIDDIELQQLIPIKKLEFKLKAPEYFVYKTLMNLRASFIPKIENSRANQKVNFSYRTEIDPGLRGNGRSERVSYTKDVMFNVMVSNLYDIPALKNEDFVDNLRNYQSKLILELNSIQYPEQPVENLSTSWNKVTKVIYNDSDFGAQLDKQNYYKEDIDALIGKTSEPLEKAVLIYNFVKRKVKWNGFIGYTAENGVKKAYNEGVGNIADINLMLTSMLKYAGLDANPVLISTRDNGIPILASRTGFNYVIAAIEFQDSLVLLDASSKYATPNILPKRILNWQGRIIREYGSSAWVSLTPNKKSKAVNILNFSIEDNLLISGKTRKQLTNNSALKYRNSYANEAEESTVKRLEKENAGLEISDLKVSNAKNANKAISYSYEFKLESAIEVIGDNLYFSPLLFLTSKENVFKQDTRLYPIDFVHPISKKYNVNIKLPEGYVVESIPENAKVNFNDDQAMFSYIAKQNGASAIQLVVSLDINKTIILPSDYNEFKQFFQFLVDKQTEKIVLKKV